MFRDESPPRVKPLLYVFRVLLTGIHLLRYGEVEANLLKLNESAKLSYVDNLIEQKLTAAEKGRLADADTGFYKQEYERLTAELQTSGEQSLLPEKPGGKAALDELLIRLRRESR